jgi:hypothetical protein
MFEFPASKLKQGYGDAIVYVLQASVDLVFSQKDFAFKKPIHALDE